MFGFGQMDCNPGIMGIYQQVMTTLEILDALLRRAESAAAEQGIPLRQLISEAIAEKLRGQNGVSKPWIGLFGQLHDLHKETSVINKTIEAEFNQVEPDEWK